MICQYTKISKFALLVSISILIVISSIKTKSDSGKVYTKEDIPYIDCQVCERTVTELFLAANAARETKPKKKLSELDIIVLIEGINNPKNQTGEWIRKLDIKEVFDKGKRYLSLVEPGDLSKCKVECLTIAESSRRLLQDEIDADDLSALLYKNKVTVEEAKDKLCKKWTSRCKPRRKSMSSTYKRIDEAFEAVSEKDLEMERLMASMESMGMGANMYSPDDLPGMMGGGDEEDDGYADPYGAPIDPYAGGMKDPYADDEDGAPFRKNNAGNKFEF